MTPVWVEVQRTLSSFRINGVVPTSRAGTPLLKDPPLFDARGGFAELGRVSAFYTRDLRAPYALAETGRMSAFFSRDVERREMERTSDFFIRKTHEYDADDDDDDIGFQSNSLLGDS